MKKILIIGATSAIAEAVARIYASRGDSLFLVARNRELLVSISEDLKVRGSAQTEIYFMDANQFDQHLPMLDKVVEIFGFIDLVLIAHGTLSDQQKCEQSVELAMQEIKTNALSVISLLTNLANLFETQGGGTIAVISSVAGDRGRQSNYVYGSAKAMVTTFISGLRQRLYKSGVSVLTIKPGFVDTPMTAEFKKGLLWTKPNTVAKKIIKSVDNKNEVVYVPGFWRFIMLIIKIVPEKIFKKVAL